MNKLSDKARIYARSYGQSPYGREIEGTTELLLQMAEKLDEYETLEEQNRLMKLPCVVGDMTYGVNKSMRWITDAIVKKIEIDADGIWVITSSGIFSVEDFEKTVFLTKEAAEAALKEMSE